MGTSKPAKLPMSLTPIKPSTTAMAGRSSERRRRRRHQRGTVENWLEEEGWYAVQLEGEAANLKPENCRADVLALQMQLM